MEERDRVEEERMRDATACCCCRRATPNCRVATLFKARARDEEAMAPTVKVSSNKGLVNIGIVSRLFERQRIWRGYSALGQVEL